MRLVMMPWIYVRPSVLPYTTSARMFCIREWGKIIESGVVSITAVEVKMRPGRRRPTCLLSHFGKKEREKPFNYCVQGHRWRQFLNIFFFTFFSDVLTYHLSVIWRTAENSVLGLGSGAGGKARNKTLLFFFDISHFWRTSKADR